MPSADPLRDLGVRAGAEGGRLRLWSEHATAVELAVFDTSDLEWAVDRVPAERDESGVWEASSRALVPGARYAVHVDGPAGVEHAFNPVHALLDPYARGLTRADDGSWRGVAMDSLAGDGFEWAGSTNPRVPLDRTIVYEAHVKGFSRRNERVPAELRGTYAGLAHDASLEYLTDLGVTSVELLPVQAFVSEERLVRQGRVNSWGYNTLGFFAPHAPYATAAAQAEGPAAVRREFAGMVKRLHEAGLEVILDVVYNHTAEEGRGGPTFGFRGIDNASYYRHDAHGRYVDTTGCGNTLDFGGAAPVRLVLDSLRYWAGELGVDGFRLDLAATLGRGDHGGFEADHPLLRGMLDDPVIGRTKLIAEPWDVGFGGWQTGQFPDGFIEWNDRYRDRMREFWLEDRRDEREHGRLPGGGLGRFAGRLSGSAHTFAHERGPLASLNFVTAHDGFTLADLVSYDRKHNEGNGEGNRDGTDANRSYNHGVEGFTDDPAVRSARLRSMRNLLGTLLCSAGVPMLTAGDEVGRTQRGNNNAYCLDSEATWIDWDLTAEQRGLLETTRRLIRLRRDNPALRPARYGVFGVSTRNASRMDWYGAEGEPMTIDDWESPGVRTLQLLLASTPESEAPNRVLLVVHARAGAAEVMLPEGPTETVSPEVLPSENAQAGPLDRPGTSGLSAHSRSGAEAGGPPAPRDQPRPGPPVARYVLLWDSAHESPDLPPSTRLPRERVRVAGWSMQLYLAET
ncbi:glycogen debranching protein GlgX [Agromyces aerolatus]|uniref:glycogen debranching protein GlgX n=1 Tax=Agromyces sp. LY-1074 TaxID=3074080 RepID=UPI00285959E1|nr:MULTISPECIES: glycogen debranching protein GlgX [unclassified Agromyces]MDR5699915.1 glycogen debranching protein GlgX [Agromyces sp. LY-1074]MDR5706273.1 glycogen debranching protein GlgX [Agromyces sp. LY-1358]